MVGLLNDRGYDVSEQQFGAFLDVFRANLACYHAYKPATLPANVDVVLYRATEQPYTTGETLPHDYGWNRLLQTPVRVHDVDGDHYSMLENVRFDALVASPAGA
jgi:thioesterase domain-containing protein